MASIDSKDSQIKERCSCQNRPARKPPAMSRDPTFLLTRYVMYSMLGRANECPSDVAEKVVDLVREVEGQNAEFFQSVCQKLNMFAENGKSTFVQVADEMFADQVNWGRVVSFYTFSAKAAQHFERLGSEEMVDSVVSWTADYVRKLKWIQSDGGGWVSTVFHQQKFKRQTEFG